MTPEPTERPNGRYYCPECGQVVRTSYGRLDRHGVPDLNRIGVPHWADEEPVGQVRCPGSHQVATERAP